MNQYERLKENRRQYRNQFLLGLFGGGGFISALILGLYNHFNRNQSKPHQPASEDEEGPEQFETIHTDKKEK